jgi:hypothetical protein
MFGRKAESHVKQRETARAESEHQQIKKSLMELGCSGR